MSPKWGVASHIAVSSKYLIAVGRDVKTVRTILRHANPMTTLQLYAHGRSQDRSDAQGEMLTAFFAPPAKPSTEMVQ